MQGNQELEKAFEAIKEGKQQRDDGENWLASEQFWEASNLLQKLAMEHPSDEEEQEKIKKLYQQQSREYLYKTRETFLEAMQVEHEMDAEKTKSQPEEINDHYYCQSLSDEEARKRIRIFASIFAKEEMQAAEDTGTTKENDDFDVLEKQSSLEERLVSLNANIPKGFKTSDERMQDINRGLNRLGLSLYTEGPTKPKIEPNKSTEQQVADIIAQAKDEVALNPKEDEASNNVGEASNNDNSALLGDDDSESSVDENSVLSDEVPVLQNVQQIKNEIAATQAKLAEVIALMDSIPSPEEEEEADLDKDQKTMGNSSHFDPACGKKTLKDAKQSLQKALKYWKVTAK